MLAQQQEEALYTESQSEQTSYLKRPPPIEFNDLVLATLLTQSFKNLGVEMLNKPSIENPMAKNIPATKNIEKGDAERTCRLLPENATKILV